MGYKEEFEVEVVNLPSYFTTNDSDIQTMIDCGIVEEVKWKPYDGCMYHYINSKGKVEKEMYMGGSKFDSRSEFLGCYKTCEEAQSMLDYIKKCVREREE